MMIKKQPSRLSTSLDIQDKLYKLFYKSDDAWKHLPDWAVFFLELGVAVSDYQQKGVHFILGISVPTRSFVAPLISAGIIAARIGRPTNVEEQINRILSFPSDTSVIFRSGSWGFRALYKEHVEKYPKKYFPLRLDKITLKFVPLNRANQIEIAGKDTFKLYDLQRGRPLPKPGMLAKELLCKSDLEKLLVETRLECVLLSQLNIMTQEISNTPFYYSSDNNDYTEAYLHDLVRPKNSNIFFAYRSLILPASGRYSQQFASKFSPYVTVFDNSLAFIKWRSSWRHSNWIVVLDRTDRNFDYAINEINGEYNSQTRLTRKLKLPIPKPPAGVELMAFEVAK